MSLVHLYGQLFSRLPVGLTRSWSSVPVYDLTSSFASKTSIRPLPAPSGSLPFTMWRLAHAVKKAECVNPVIASMANPMALGFLLENQHLFDYSGPQFNLADGAASYLDDFSRTGLTGRLAQGFALLQMENEGYAFAGRFDTFRKKCGVAVPTVPSKRKDRFGKRIPKRIRSPDFVVEKRSGDRALVESKGSFLDSGKVADIKGSMSDALKQLAPWGSQFSPAITKKFAVGTYLHEPDVDDVEPSLLAFVDPEGGRDEDAVSVPPDLVRRLNYAGWLSAMGYRTPSRNLASQRSPDRIREIFQVAEFRGRRYAYVPTAWVPIQKPDDFLQVFHLPPRSPGDYLMSNFHDACAQMVLVLALDMQVLELLARASQTRNWSLLEDAPSDPNAAGTASNDEGGSRFIDGSFFGLVHPGKPIVSSSEEVVLEF